MDYLEVTKNESLRKYEENVNIIYNLKIYLLGKIFSFNSEKNGENKEQEDDDSDSSSDTDSNNSDSYDLSLQQEIINLFSNANNLHNHSSKNDCNKNYVEIEKFLKIKNQLENKLSKGENSEETTSLLGNW